MDQTAKLQIETLEDFIEFAPKDPGPIADDLVGWRRYDDLEICSHCSGRIHARGFSGFLRGYRPVWAPDKVKCSLPSCQNI